MATFGQAIPSQGIFDGLLGYSLKREYLGEAFNFRNVETFTYEIRITDLSNIGTNAAGQNSLSTYINNQIATKIGTDKKNIEITSIEVPSSANPAEELIRLGTYKVTTEVRNRIGDDIMWIGYCYNPTSGTCSNNAFDDDEDGCITDVTQCSHAAHSTQALCESSGLNTWTPNTWTFDDHDTNALCGAAGGTWKTAQHTELDPTANTATTKQYQHLNDIFQTYGKLIDSIDENISIDEDNQKNKTITHTVNVQVRHSTSGSYVNGVWVEEDATIPAAASNHAMWQPHKPWEMAVNIADLLFRSMEVTDLGKYVFPDKVKQYSAYAPWTSWHPVWANAADSGGNNRYTETYDDLNRKYSFVRKQKILNNEGIQDDYTTNVKHTVSYEKEGTVTITEDLVLRAKYRGIIDPITKYIAQEKEKSWDRCWTVLDQYSAQAASQPQYINFLEETLANGSVVRNYNEQPVSQNVAINIQENTATITTVYSNSPKLSTSTVDGNLSIEVDDKNISTVSYDVNFKLFEPKKHINATDPQDSGDKTPMREHLDPHSANIIDLLITYDQVFDIFDATNPIITLQNAGTFNRFKYHFPFSEVTSTNPFGSASQLYHYSYPFAYRAEGDEEVSHPEVANFPTASTDYWTLLTKTFETTAQGKSFALKKKWTNDPAFRVKTLPGCTNCFKKVTSKISDTWPKAMFSEHVIVDRDPLPNDNLGTSVMSYNYQTEVGKRNVTLTSIIPRRKWNQLLHSWNHVNESGGPYVPINELKALAKEAKQQLLTAFQHTRLANGFRIAAYLSDLSYVFDSNGNVTLTAEMTYGIKSTDMIPLTDPDGNAILKDNIPLNYTQ